MSFFDFLSLIGGLALFLYGMQVMGGGLSKLAGGSLEHILEKLTDTKLKGILLGAAVTAIIQSSSGTTVMVVGFVNSGIMQLKQAVGIIYGANIGTTITSWILSLSGIESSNFWIRMLKPSSFSPILALIGITLLLFSKTEKKHDIGNILLGFAILMFGMDTMSKAVAPLANVPEFTNILLLFNNPLLGMMAGAVLTAIIQSSAASIGILQALCVSGAVYYSNALPIVIGETIGTCATAMLSSIGSKANARRAAMLHLLLNIMASFSFLVIFYSINSFVHFSFMEEKATPVGIAFMLTAFKIAEVVIFYPFSDFLIMVSERLVKPDKDDLPMANPNERYEDLKLLDERFLAKPAIAVSQSYEVLRRMASLSRQSMITSLDNVDNYDENNGIRVRALEKQVRAYVDALGEYIMKLTNRQLSVKDTHTVSMMLHCIGDFERITDRSVNIIEATEAMNTRELHFTDTALHELQIYSRALRDISEPTLDVFFHQNINSALEIIPFEEVIDNLHEKIRSNIVKRIQDGLCTVEVGIIMEDLITNYERISDHCYNVAMAIIRVNAESRGMDAKSYTKNAMNYQSAEFRQLYRKYEDAYAIEDYVLAAPAAVDTAADTSYHSSSEDHRAEKDHSDTSFTHKNNEKVNYTEIIQRPDKSAKPDKDNTAESEKTAAEVKTGSKTGDNKEYKKEDKKEDKKEIKKEDKKDKKEDKLFKQDKSGKSEKAIKHDKAEKSLKSDKQEKSGKNSKPDKSYKGEKSFKTDKPSDKGKIVKDKKPDPKGKSGKDKYKVKGKNSEKSKKD